jgi:hypothetical protein
VRFPGTRPGEEAKVRASVSLLLFGDEQICFPGIDGYAAQSEAGSRTEPGAEPPMAGPGVAHCPGQLCFGPSQMLLADADPDPRQPSLLPEPPPWDLVEPLSAPVPPHSDRSPRIRQEPLFPHHG